MTTSATKTPSRTAIRLVARIVHIPGRRTLVLTLKTKASQLTVSASCAAVSSSVRRSPRRKSTTKRPTMSVVFSSCATKATWPKDLTSSRRVSLSYYRMQGLLLTLLFRLGEQHRLHLRSEGFRRPTCQPRVRHYHRSGWHLSSCGRWVQPERSQWQHHASSDMGCPPRRRVLLRARYRGSQEYHCSRCLDCLRELIWTLFSFSGIMAFGVL
jgi:hypothetical protein